MKEIRLHPRISEHDLDIKINHSKAWIDEKNKVRVTVVFRGREMEHRDLGMKLLNRIKETLVDKCVVEQESQLEGNRLSILLAPKK